MMLVQVLVMEKEEIQEQMVEKIGSDMKKVPHNESLKISSAKVLQF